MVVAIPEGSGRKKANVSEGFMGSQVLKPRFRLRWGGVEEALVRLKMNLFIMKWSPTGLLVGRRNTKLLSAKMPYIFSFRD